MSEEQFIEWLPDKFRMQAAITEKRKTGEHQHVPVPERLRSADQNALRLARRPQAECRDTPCKRAQRKTDAGPHAELMIRESWRRSFLKDPDSSEAKRRLERARYINAMDWLTRWMELYEENSNLDASEAFINEYLAGRKPDVNAWQQQTHGSRHMIIETARWLNGERDPEPATMLVAEGLGLRNRSVEPHIDTDFLNRLTLHSARHRIADRVGELSAVAPARVK